MRRRERHRRTRDAVERARRRARRSGSAHPLRLAVVASVVASLALTACASRPAPTPPPVPSGVPGTGIPVEINSFYIQPSVASAKAGKLSFVVSNGALDIRHEFVVVASDKPADQLPVEDDAVPEAKVDIVDGLEPFPPGETKTLTVDLMPGHYVFMCNVPGHYLYGMRLDFTVQP
jgi:uncharacterized cupredoxin-like copper-binding protein